MKAGEAQTDKAMMSRINLPIVDISEQTEMHIFVVRGSETEWNGHPRTVLPPDGKTIFCVWQAHALAGHERRGW